MDVALTQLVCTYFGYKWSFRGVWTRSGSQVSPAEKLCKSLQPLNTLLWTAPFYPVAKSASNFAGNDVGECRRPVEPLTPETIESVKLSVDAAFAPI